jgi:hypothetical protein
MSVYRGRPEVMGARLKRRFLPQAGMLLARYAWTEPKPVSQLVAYFAGHGAPAASHCFRNSTT